MTTFMNPNGTTLSLFPKHDVSAVGEVIKKKRYIEHILPIEDAKRIATKGRVLKLPPPQKRQYRITITVIKYK